LDKPRQPGGGNQAVDDDGGMKIIKAVSNSNVKTEFKQSQRSPKANDMKKINFEGSSGSNMNSGLNSEVPKLKPAFVPGNLGALPSLNSKPQPIGN
jgi:hypothetical protein